MNVRVCSIQKTVWKSNPLSGHSWPEYGPITGWEVRRPFGQWSKHRTEAAAEKEADELRAFYEKYPVEGLCNA
jgi:hypothetical protein